MCVCVLLLLLFVLPLSSLPLNSVWLCHVTHTHRHHNRGSREGFSTVCSVRFGAWGYSVEGNVACTALRFGLNFQRELVAVYVCVRVK